MEATTAVRQAEVTAQRVMIDRTQERFGIWPERLAADTGYGSADRPLPSTPAIRPGTHQDFFNRIGAKRSAYIRLGRKVLGFIGAYEETKRRPAELEEGI